MATILRVLESVGDVPRETWDALVGDESPFLEWDWLAALEAGGSVDRNTGWQPQHLTLWDGDTLVGACPLYLKAHSMGEFVFDWSWANAAHRAGMEYYPKLLVAVPFTPVTGARFLARAGDGARVRTALASALERLCADTELSSAHVNFCRPDEADALAERGWLRRHHYQFQWRNPGFATFDDYLVSLRSKRRNQVLRERRELAEQRVEIRTYVGDDVPADLAHLVYRIYRATVDANPYGHRYLTQAVFERVFERFRRRICLVLARQGGEIIAGTFNVQKGDALYGRYWGALRPLRHLHFNVCYYAAIEHCITAKLARFEPGAGGEFKQMRGFDATRTESMHWIRDRRFRDAVDRFLLVERQEIAREIADYIQSTSHRRD